jgi:WD40 repeat protein
VASGQPYKYPPLKHSDRVTGVAFSPDGKLFLTAGGKAAQLWDLLARKPVGPPLEHADSIFSAAWSDDGRTVATASRDRTARLWDAATGQALGPPLLHGDHVHSIAFAAGGKVVATGSLDGFARLWPLLSIDFEPERVVLWSQVVTGMELTQSGKVQPLAPNEWQARTRKFDAAKASQ